MNKKKLWHLALMSFISSNVDASTIIIESTGLWTVSGLPQINISAEIDYDAFDLRSDSQAIGKYQVNNLRITFGNTSSAYQFSNTELIADKNKSFVDIYNNGGALSFYGWFSTNHNKLSNGNLALDYRFTFGSPDLKTDSLHDLSKLSSIFLPYGQSFGYMSTLISTYSSEIWDSKINISTNVNLVPTPSTLFLIAAAIPGLGFFNRQYRNAKGK